MKLDKKKVLYPFYVLGHPSDGFYEIRHRNMGSVPLAVALVAFFSFSFSFNRECASFVVNNIRSTSVNTIMELGGVLMLYGLFCVANWSVTCLLEGEGRLKDIAIVTGYSMLPLSIVFIPATLISQVIAANEEAFYSLLLALGVGYFIVLILVGLMTVHNFSLGKTLLIVICTFISMLLIIFVALLLFTLIQQVYQFFYSIYTELLFRA